MYKISLGISQKPKKMQGQLQICALRDFKIKTYTSFLISIVDNLYVPNFNAIRRKTKIMGGQLQT